MLLWRCGCRKLKNFEMEQLFGILIPVWGEENELNFFVTKRYRLLRRVARWYVREMEQIVDDMTRNASDENFHFDRLFVVDLLGPNWTINVRWSKDSKIDTSQKTHWGRTSSCLWLCEVHTAKQRLDRDNIRALSLLNFNQARSLRESTRAYFHISFQFPEA